MAVYAVFKSTMIATKNLYISGVIMLLYGCSTGVIRHDMTILTESIAISISAFFLLSIVKYVDSCSCKDGMIAVLIAFLATCEKVTLAVYIGVILVLLILQFFIYPTKRKSVLKIGGAVGVASILCLAYAAICWMNYGTFSLTNLGPRHSLVPCIVTESYKNYPDEELVSEIEAIIESRKAEGGDIRDWDTTTPIMELFGDTERERNIRMAEFTSYCKRSDRKAYGWYLLNMINRYKKDRYAQSEMECNSWISAKTWEITQKFGFLRIETGFWVILFSTVAAILLWIFDKKCPWYFLGTAGTLLIIEVSVFTQSYSDFKRLTAYTQPFIYFGFAILFHLLVQQMRKLVLYGRDHVQIELQ